MGLKSGALEYQTNTHAAPCWQHIEQCSSEVRNSRWLSPSYTSVGEEARRPFLFPALLIITICMIFIWLKSKFRFLKLRSVICKFLPALRSYNSPMLIANIWKMSNSTFSFSSWLLKNPRFLFKKAGSRVTPEA